MGAWGLVSIPGKLRQCSLSVQTATTILGMILVQIKQKEKRRNKEKGEKIYTEAAKQQSFQMLFGAIFPDAFRSNSITEAAWQQL